MKMRLHPSWYPVLLPLTSPCAKVTLDTCSLEATQGVSSTGELKETPWPSHSDPSTKGWGAWRGEGSMHFPDLSIGQLFSTWQSFRKSWDVYVHILG
jgi:hypothetical protein